MPTRYLEVLAAHPPFPSGLDPAARTLFSCNYNTVADGASGDFEGEIAALIVNTTGVGVKGSTLFNGPEAKIPAGDGPFVTVVNRGGLPSHETHNADEYVRRRVQIVVTATVYSQAKDRAEAIWRAIGRLREQVVTALP
jgi:hypothetical protein